MPNIWPTPMSPLFPTVTIVTRDGTRHEGIRVLYLPGTIQIFARAELELADGDVLERRQLADRPERVERFALRDPHAYPGLLGVPPHYEARLAPIGDAARSGPADDAPKGPVAGLRGARSRPRVARDDHARPRGPGADTPNASTRLTDGAPNADSRAAP